MYNKEGKIKLETSAHYVPIGNTKITFYDSDIGTADLIFYITRNQRPLEVSDENVDCFLMLKAKDGTYIVDTAHVIDPLNGKVSYTIPKEFLTHTGSVKGQVWITVHGKEDMITEVEFSFTIKDSMFTTIPAVDKVNYIRTFEDLRERIEDRVQYIEESLANGDDHVSQMDATFHSGMKSLNDRSAQVINEIKSLADNHKQELNNLKDNNIIELDNKANQIKEDIEELNNYDTSNWQKHKLTGDDGSLERVLNVDLDNPEASLSKTCFVYVSAVTNQPPNMPENGYLFFYRRIADYMKMEYRPYNSDRVFHRTKSNGSWLDWTEISNDQTDTGWIPFNLINGSLSNTAYKSSGDNGFNCAYRTVVNGSVVNRYLRINATNLTPGQIIANLPSNFCKNAQTFPIRIPTKYAGGYLVIRPNGEIKFYINGDSSAWISTDYAYGEITWTD